MKPLGAFQTFAAWMAAALYLAAGLHLLGGSHGWWDAGRGSTSEVAVLTGFGGFFLLWVVGPVTWQVFAGLDRATRAQRALTAALKAAATVAALSSAAGAGLVVIAVLLGVFRDFALLFSMPVSGGAPFDTAGYWLLTVGLLGPWLIHLGLAARRAKTWSPVQAGLAIAAGATALLVPVTLLDLPPFVGFPLSVCVAIVGGLALPAWLLFVSARAGSVGGAARIAACTLLPLLLLVAGIQLWARGRLAVYEKAWQADLAAERGRVAALRMPVLFGEPESCNAAQRYLPVLDSLHHSGYPDGRPSGKDDELLRDGPALAELGRAASAGPFERVPEKITAILDKRRALVTALRAATRCDRVDWGFPYERFLAASFPSFTAARTLAHLAVLEGHERAQAGDLQGAAEHYLGVMRFGADVATQGPLLHGHIGMGLRDIGQGALGQLLAVGAEPGRLPVSTIAEAQRRLDAVPASMAAAYRGERLGWPSVWTGLGPPLFRRLVLRPLFAHALGEMLPLLRAAEQAAGEADVVRASARLEPAFQAAARSRTSAVRQMLPSLGYFKPAARVRAHGAVLGAALAAEAARQGGHYPAELPDLPVDPFAYPNRVHYRLDAAGAGYTVWSVGENGKDDGGTRGWEGEWLRAPVGMPDGTVDDIVLARATTISRSGRSGDQQGHTP